MATHDPNITRQEASTTDKVKTAAEDTVQQARQKAEEYAGMAQERAIEAARSQKAQAAEGLGSVASAFRETGQHLRSQDQGPVANTVAQYTDRVAEQVDRFAQQLRHKDVNELISDVEDMARQQPAIFLGGAFAAGLLLARFLKSSGTRHEMRTRRPYYGAEEYSRERALTRRPTTTTTTSTRTSYGQEDTVRETSEERRNR